VQLRSHIRNLIMGLALAAVALFAAADAQRADAQSGSVHTSRYLQHRDAPPAAPESYVEGAWNSHLPLLCIDTGGTEIPGTPILDKKGGTIGYVLAADGGSTIPAQLAVFEKEGVYHQPGGRPDHEISAEIRVRGNTSRLFDKQSYKLNLYDAEGLELPVDLLGMGAHDEWALYGPFLDKTMLRNYLILNLCGEAEPYTPDLRYCELMLNGEYRGLYVLMETISQGQSRVGLSPSSTRRDKTSYILRIDRTSNEPEELNTFSFYTHNLEHITKAAVIYPGSQALNETFHAYIEADFNAFEKALYSYDFKDPQKGYRAYIDVQSFVDYYIFSEFWLINDMCNRSTYFYKDLGGKLHIGPCWDFNNAGNNFLKPVGGADGTGFQYAERTWYRMLLKDDDFVEQVIERYRELRNGGTLDTQRIFAEMDAIVAFLGPAIGRDHAVWGYSYDVSQVNNHNRLRPLDRNPENYEEALADLRNFIQIRGAWMDENIEALRQYCHASLIKQYLD